MTTSKTEKVLIETMILVPNTKVTRSYDDMYCETVNNSTSTYYIEISEFRMPKAQEEGVIEHIITKAPLDVTQTYAIKWTERGWEVDHDADVRTSQNYHEYKPSESWMNVALKETRKDVNLLQFAENTVPDIAYLNFACELFAKRFPYQEAGLPGPRSAYGNPYTTYCWGWLVNEGGNIPNKPAFERFKLDLTHWCDVEIANGRDVIVWRKMPCLEDGRLRWRCHTIPMSEVKKHAQG